MSFLKNQLEEIEHLMQYENNTKATVSKADIAWHLDHMLRVINSIYDAMEASDIALYRKSINLIRSAVFTSGKIPRGKGRAPKSVVAKEEITISSIKALIEEARQKLILIDKLHKYAHFEHPVFGTLDRKGAKRFLEIHTNHHLKIVKDILK